MRKRPTSQLVLGSFVRLVPDGSVHRIIWRGKQLVPSLTGQLYEVSVYRLSNEHWDCYYESDLQAVFS